MVLKRRNWSIGEYRLKAREIEHYCIRKEVPAMKEEVAYHLLADENQKSST